MSNLLEKASIVTTPTAYDNGKILSVKPAKPYSDEITVNGNFDTDSDWTKDAGWTISNGEAIHTGSGSYISQTGTTIGKNYKVVIEVTQASGSGFPQIYMGGLTTAMTSVGTYTFDITATSTLIRLRGVNDCKVTSISVKEVLHADFDFTRNSSATRVNSQGLIEDVQILSSNLVQNGDFSQEGSEQITNGDFATDSNWTISSSASVGENKLNVDASAFDFFAIQTALTNGLTYKVTLDAEVTTGDILLYTGAQFATINSSDSYTFYTTANSAQIRFRSGGSGFEGSIDNVSVKEVGQGWTVSNGTITDKYNASMTAYQTGIRILPFSNTGTFKVVFDLVVTSGSCKFDAGGSNNAIYSTSGTKELIATNITKFEFNAFNLGWVGTLDNVSVIEITEDTNLPRIDYTGGEGHWLFEPQSTNLIIQSQSLNSALNLKADTTITDNYGISPTGEANSSRIQFADTTAFCYAAVSVSTDHTASVFVKGVSGETVRFGIGTNVTTGELFTFNGLWQRINFTASSAAQIFFSSYSGATTSDFEAFGLQLEALSFATSYIPTNGSTVTRLQDAAFGAGSSDLINSTEGVLYAEIAALNSVTSPSSYITISDGTYNNRASIFFSSGATNQIRTFLRVGGASQIDVSNNVSDVTDFNKIAFSYKENNFKVYINGALVSTDTSGSVWSADTVTKLSFSEINTSVGSFQGKAKCVAVFKEALTDAELTCLTTI